jgi:hypothetical protein
MTSRLTALIALLALPLAACDAQSDDGYQGEPLVTLSGTVQNAGIQAPTGVDLVVAYFVPPADPYESFCLFDAKAALDAGETPDLDCRFRNLAPERVEVTGEFPAAFQFALLHPPPANALTTDAAGHQLAIADIFAVTKGSADDGELRLGDLVGYSPEGIVYVGADVPSADVKAGFHLFRALCGGQAVEPGAACAVLADGEPVTVALTDLATIVQQSVSTWTAM